MSPTVALLAVPAFVFGLFLLSRTSGWNTLAKLYPFHEQDRKEFPRFFSASIEGTGLQLLGAYPSFVIKLGISEEGLSLVSRLPFHRSILVPWPAVASIEGGANWFLMSETINLKGSGARVVLKKWGVKKDDVDISRYWNSYGVG